jgi:flagellar biosynthesis chaperone FliJ
MVSLSKKSKRLDPIIEDRKTVFDEENQKLVAVRQKKIAVVAEMKAKQREYITGVERLNSERGSTDRLLLNALEMGLDSVKQSWMKLYQAVLECEREEEVQFNTMNLAHRNLEAIKHLKQKYDIELTKESNRREQKATDELALRRFSHS